ncbi:MAG: hypothetical protein AAF411_31645 [Myxococcota bacterium]
MARTFLLCTISLALGCERDVAEGSAGERRVDLGVQVEATESPEPPASEPASSPVELPEPELEIEVRIEDGMAFVPAATVLAGSAPGTPGRDARAEADLVPLELGAYWIDVEPAETRHLGHAAATVACETEGKRLCSELEWEYACEGPRGERFAGGATYDAEAVSVYGVRGMGGLGEWTAGAPVRDVAGSRENGAVFRGARPDADEALRRCASRRGTSAATESRHLGFRCCRSEGAELTPSYPDEPVLGRFHDLNLDEARLREVLASVPELAALAGDFRPLTLDAARASIGAEVPEGFDAMDEEAAALALRTPQKLFGWEIAPAALRWSPTPGDVLWVINGFVGERPAAFVLYPMPDGTFRHATSMVLEASAPAIAMAYTPSERTYLKWSARWGTSAEGGLLNLGDYRTVAFDVR